jgi:hypothetical protein
MLSVAFCVVYWDGLLYFLLKHPDARLTNVMRSHDKRYYAA